MRAANAVTRRRSATRASGSWMMNEKRRRSWIAPGDRRACRQRGGENGVGARRFAPRHADDAAGAAGAHLGANLQQPALRLLLERVRRAAAVEPQAVVARGDCPCRLVDVDFAALVAEHDDDCGEPVDRLRERLDVGVEPHAYAADLQRTTRIR